MVNRLSRSGDPIMRPRSSLTPAASHAASRTFMPSLDLEKYMYNGGTFASSGKMMPSGSRRGACAHTQRVRAVRALCAVV